jgi:hypothetical protein
MSVRMRPLAAVACLSAAGCALLSPLGDLRTPADRAREVSPLCKSVREDDMAVLLSPSSVDTVQPAYATVPSGPAEREARLQGVRIRLRPTPGMSSETLTRSIECHQARVTLGELVPDADDPYVLPGVWLDLDASSARDSFVIVVGADDIEDARLVLERARRFMARSAAPAATP